VNVGRVSSAVAGCDETDRPELLPPLLLRRSRRLWRDLHGVSPARLRARVISCVAEDGTLSLVSLCNLRGYRLSDCLFVTVDPAKKVSAEVLTINVFFG